MALTLDLPQTDFDDFYTNEFKVLQSRVLALEVADDTKPPVVTIPPVVVPVPPVIPVGKLSTSNILLAGSFDWIMRADNVKLDFSLTGAVRFGGRPIPGSEGTSAVAYEPRTNTTYRRVSPIPGWARWGGSMTAADWAASTWMPGQALPVPPPVVIIPPVVVPPTSGSPRDKLIAYLMAQSGVKCLIGQTSKADSGEFNAVTGAFGFSPGIMFNDPWVVQWAGNAPFDAGFMPAALAHAKSGGIVGMSLLLPNPVDGGPSNGGARVDPVQVITLGSASNNALNRMLDQAAGLLQQFKDIGKAVLTRYMFELDGGWFWWGTSMSGAQQTALYGYITRYLRVTKGLDNLLTTFGVNGGPGTYEYPGDVLVDVVGIDCYTDTLAGTYKGTYDRLRAQAPSKLFALTEDGSGGPDQPDRNYDMNRLKADIQSGLPRAVYSNFWSGWGPNLMGTGKTALSDPFWVNKSQIVM